jgi:hypothetical protein
VKWILTLCALLAALPAQAASGLSLLPAQADRISLAFELDAGYILLPGTVRGVSGVVMLDTGTPFTLLLNNTLIPLELTGTPSPGRAGSGQTFEITRHDEIGPLTIAGQHLSQTGPVISGTLRWMSEEFRPDFLGFAGYALIREHEMVVDYQAQRIELHRLGADGSRKVAPPALPANAITLRFDGFDDNRPNLPYVMTTVAGLEIEVMFDTGTNAYLDLTPQGRKTLEAAQAVQMLEGGGVRLPGLTLGGVPAPNAVKTIQDAKKNRLVMGYESLVLYRSIWNYSRGEITLVPVR